MKRSFFQRLLKQQADHACRAQIKWKKAPFNKAGSYFQTIELGIRLMMAIGFCLAAAILGYPLGATIWSGIGIIPALTFMPFGFIYGFFAVEINFFMRMAFKAFRLWAGF